MATTYTAKAVAREVAKRLNRPFDAKRVRAWVRENIAAYDDDGYTAHAYDHATFTRIVSALVARGRTPRTVAASKGRSGKVATPKVKTPKVPPTRPMGSGPVARVAPESKDEA